MVGDGIRECSGTYIKSSPKSGSISSGGVCYYGGIHSFGRRCVLCEIYLWNLWLCLSTFRLVFWILADSSVLLVMLLHTQEVRFLKNRGSLVIKLLIAIHVGKLGKVNCTTCGGDGQIETSGPCTAHTVSGGHYYCTSSSHHGNNIVQYHK